MGPFIYMFELEPIDGGERTKLTNLMRLTGGPEQEAMMAAGGRGDDESVHRRDR
jgi:hypothetical protein